MKQYLSFLWQLTLITTLTLPTIACGYLTIGGGTLEPGEQEEPITKDITYYLALIKEQDADIVEWNEILVEIKDNKDGYDDEQEYQSAIDEVKAEQYFCKALINEYQYQILLLDQQGDDFTLDQILKAIVIFSEKILNSEQELKLKEKYSYYTEQELQIIRNRIAEAKTMLKIFEELKEE